MKRFLVLLVMGLLTLQFGCQNEVSNDSEASEFSKPHDPWVFRSVLDRIPRVITVALHEKIWLAYSIEHAQLYKAWRGTVNFEGPVYDMAHGPQPTSVGDAYIKNELKSPWALFQNDVRQETQLNYLGHRLKTDEVELSFELLDPQGESIIITETPQARESDSGLIEFTRTFTVKGLKEGQALKSVERFTSIITKAQVAFSGAMNELDVRQSEFNGRTFENLKAELVMNKDGIYTLKTSFYDATILDPNIEEDISESAPSGALLISKHGCRTCHNKNLKTIGPAYIAVAKRYGDTDENKVMLAAKIKSGGSGKWGNQVMNPHPEVPDVDLKDMVEYILSLGDPENTNAGDDRGLTIDPEMTDGSSLIPGAFVQIFNIPSDTERIPTKWGQLNAIQTGVLPNFDNISGGDFVDLNENFALRSQGYLEIEEDGIYEMRIWSDDGSKVTLGEQTILDHDGPHGTSMKQVKLNLKKGFYPFELEFFQGLGGKFLSWNYKPESSDFWQVIPREIIHHDTKLHSLIGTLDLPMAGKSEIPGDRSPVVDVHPSFDLFQARPNAFEPKVGGMDFMSNGDLIISTWDPNGAVYRLSNIEAENNNDIVVQKIAIGLAEPLGVSVVDDEIYVMQKQELTKLVDEDGDGIIDHYRTLCDDWGVSANFHEFGFGLEYKDGYFYAALATAIEPGGASTNPQIPDRGKAIKINKETGTIEFIAHGLRTPNGVGRGYNDEIFIADNQGDWLPASKIVHVKKDAWYGSRSVDFEGTADLEEELPVVWLPQDEIGNSPSTPSYIEHGPYKGQMIHGEVTNGGVKRVFVEEVDGKLQGCVFRFIQGLEAGVNRLRWAENGDLYVGGIGNSGNWQHSGRKWFGIQRLKYNEQSTFEMLAVRAKSNGLEIEFTEPLAEGDGYDPDDYEIKRWWYKPTIEYGGPKLDERFLPIQSVSISGDRKKVFLELSEMKANHVYYIRLKNKFISQLNHSLWSTETWYTMNNVPKNDLGQVQARRILPQNNTLTDKEKEEGWELLFDGKSLNEWRNFNKTTTGSSWVIDTGTIHLESRQNEDGSWSAPDGGDIITKKEYENFELRLEWKISNCGNSGIMFNVKEDEKYCCPWQTGPEMQVLDNTCHPDSKFITHRAGDLYDMIECKFTTVNPAGRWNKVRVISQNGKVQFWLNGYEVVSFEMHTEEWDRMIANSKFNKVEDPNMADFGVFKKGHICLQDHSDKVWYRNIKIKEL